MSFINIKQPCWDKITLKLIVVYLTVDFNHTSFLTSDLYF